MNILKKIRIFLANHLYSKKPTRNDNGNIVTKVVYEFFIKNDILVIDIERKCSLEISNINKNTFDTFIDFKSKDIDWTDTDKAIDICYWFINRGCKIGISNSNNSNNSFYESFIESLYIETLLSHFSEKKD